MPDADLVPFPADRDERFFALILSGVGVQQASDQCGFSSTAGYRRVNSPAFRERLREVRALLAEQLAASLSVELSAVAARALSTLDEIASDRGAPAGARVRAAEASLRGALRAIELGELSSRLSELEAALGSVEFRPSGSRILGGGR